MDAQDEIHREDCGMTLKNLAGAFLLYGGVAPFLAALAYVALLGGV